MPDGGGLVQPQPARRDMPALPRPRGRAAAPAAARDRRRDGARPARPAAAARPASAPARPACLPGRAARRWRTARRRAGCRRCGRPARGAATRAAAATPAPPGTPPPRPGRTGPPRPGRPAAPARPAGPCAGSRGGITRASCLSRSCRVQAGCCSETRTRALASARACASRDGGPAGAAASRDARAPARPGRARSRRGRDAGQLAAERHVPPRGQRVPVDRARVLALAGLQRRVVGDVEQLARGRRAAVPGAATPARARVPSRAPGRSAWSRRPSAPA